MSHGHSNAVSRWQTIPYWTINFPCGDRRKTALAICLYLIKIKVYLELCWKRNFCDYLAETEYNNYLTYIFEPTILMGVLFGLAGVAAAFHFGHLNAFFGALAVIGAVLAQIGVNLVDDYVDYRNGIDKESVKTKFSGGSDALISGRINPKGILSIIVLTALIGIGVGLYISYFYPVVLFVIILGAISVIFYPSVIVRVPYLAEHDTMLGFTLIAIGCYLAASGGFVTGLPSALFALLPVGMLGGIALFVNNVPDKEVDRKHGRRSMVIMLWKNVPISNYYAVLEFIVYGIIVAGIALGVLSQIFLITLLSAPASFKVFEGIRKYKNPKSYEKFMAIGAAQTAAFAILVIISLIVW